MEEVYQYEKHNTLYHNYRAQYYIVDITDKQVL